jgi:hypothetical protein
MNKQDILGLDYLKEILDYDILDGIFRWKVKRNSYRGMIGPGVIAGTIDQYGYRVIRIDGKNYFAHRLAWFYHYGVWPVGEIDHRNMVPDDNRIENLRDVGIDRALQRANQKVRKDSKIGLKGVQRTKEGRFRARLCSKSLGEYDTPEEAHAAYVVAAKRKYGEFSRAV